MSKSGSSLLRGAPRSEPSSPYVQAWYGHWIVPRVCGSFTSTVPRWRQTLRKARSSPSRSRTTTTGSPPTCVGNMLPGPFSSPVCPAYCQERRKIRSRSAAGDRGVGVPAVRQRLDARLDLRATHRSGYPSKVDMRKQLSQDENRGSVGTLARGLDILELFAGESPELTQTEISERLGLPVPTVHRLAKLLTERGWLVRDPGTRRLRLGPGRGAAPAGGPACRHLAREPLRALAERTGETANLATLDGGEVLYLVSETGSHLLTLRSHVGLRLPVHATALGQCLLAQLDDDAARAGGRATSPTRRSRRARSRAGASSVRTWSACVATALRYSRGEFEIGLHSVAVPLPWMEGDGPVAVNVSLPSSRGGRDATAGLVRELHAAVAAIAGGATAEPGAT